MLSAFFGGEPVEIRDMDVHAALELRRVGASESLVVRRVSGEFAHVSPEDIEFRYESLQTVEIARTGTRVGILPERGGLISSLSIRGTELLYMDENTLFDASQNMKGGIPYLFPNAGPIAVDKQDRLGTALPQHGFARTLPWETLPPEGHAFVQELRSERIPTRYGYPGGWRVVNTVSIETDGSVRLAHRVENLSDTPLLVSSGLHPYFRVPGDKGMIAWDFAGGEEIARHTGWSIGEACFTDWPTGDTVQARIPGLGTLSLTASPDYRRLWIWSMKDRDFVCIEPTMNHYDGLADTPAVVAPGKMLESWLFINFEPEV